MVLDKIYETKLKKFTSDPNLINFDLVQLTSTIFLLKSSCSLLAILKALVSPMLGVMSFTSSSMELTTFPSRESCIIRPVLSCSAASLPPYTGKPLNF